MSETYQYIRKPEAHTRVGEVARVSTLITNVPISAAVPIDPAKNAGIDLGPTPDEGGILLAREVGLHSFDVAVSEEPADVAYVIATLAAVIAGATITPVPNGSELTASIVTLGGTTLPNEYVFGGGEAVFVEHNDGANARDIYALFEGKF